MPKKPPYEITDKMVNLSANISALLPSIAPKVRMRLRKDRHIRSVHASLAIENNTLSLEQVADVINGRRVVGSPSEILEVKNAFAAYSQLARFKPFSIPDFLRTHKLIMQELVEGAGKFRMAVLQALKHTDLSRKERFTAIAMPLDFRAFKRNIEPLIHDGYIEMTIPDKPGSKLQTYRLTASGTRIIG